MAHLTFNVDGGKTSPQGKPSWPDYLSLEMSKKEALRQISKLAHMVATAEESETIAIFLPGVLTQEED